VCAQKGWALRIGNKGEHKGEHAAASLWQLSFDGE